MVCKSRWSACNAVVLLVSFKNKCRYLLRLVSSSASSKNTANISGSGSPLAHDCLIMLSRLRVLNTSLSLSTTLAAMLRSVGSKWFFGTGMTRSTTSGNVFAFSSWRNCSISFGVKKDFLWLTICITCSDIVSCTICMISSHCAVGALRFSTNDS